MEFASLTPPQIMKFSITFFYILNEGFPYPFKNLIIIKFIITKCYD